MKEVFQELGEVAIEAAGSKKVVAAMAGIAIVGLKALGLSIPDEAVVQVVGLIAAYLVSQGLADIGKEKR